MYLTARDVSASRSFILFDISSSSCTYIGDQTRPCLTFGRARSCYSLGNP